MIQVTKMVEEDVIHKIDHNEIIKLLPPQKGKTFITFVATKRRQKNDKWQKDGALHVVVVLPYSKVKRMSKKKTVTFSKNLSSTSMAVK